jgi:hypothetical protein
MFQAWILPFCGSRPEVVPRWSWGEEMEEEEEEEEEKEEGGSRRRSKSNGGVVEWKKRLHADRSVPDLAAG